MRFRIVTRKIHKWVGLLLAIQILFWFFSGFLMSFMPIEEIHGDHILVPAQSEPVTLQPQTVQALAAQLNTPMTSLRAKFWLGRKVIEVTTPEKIVRFDADGLQALPPIDESQVRQIITQQVLPHYDIKTIRLLSEVPGEARGREAPLWQVELSGDEDPNVYISAQTGDIVAVRTDRWRLFDFVWMLHIMDYDERTDFNHPLLYLTALSALLFTISGIILLFFGFKRLSK
ncbi:MAG: PepSY domain-containing protein [Proteobacteria bacterium]|nr:MAG: PepSY domain-containing protein [Pseudomonadota bacterium]